MLDWVLHMTATGTLAVVFVLSVNHKVRGFARFAASLAAYRLFPAGLSRSAAVMVIVMEVAAIVALFTPSGEGMWIAFGLLTLYSLALAINLLRGNTAIDCGCGDLPTPISGWLLLRNGFLLVLAME